MPASRVEIVVDANTRALGPNLTQGAAAVTRFEQTVRQSLARAQTAFSALTGGQRAFAAIAVGAGLAGVALAATVGPAIRFESAFAGVKKTVDGTPAQLNAIRSGILGMSQVMPTAADELASIAENAGQLGVKAPDILEFTRTVAMLGETTDLDFDQAAQSLARFLNVTGAGAGEIGRVADVIVELGNNSATTESQIVAFSTRLASAFTTAGASEDQILAVAAAFSSMGIQAEAGGSSLSKIITSISDAAIDGGGDLITYASTAGVLPEVFREIAAESPVEALLLFGEGLARVRAEGGSITPILEDLKLAGLRTSEIFRLLALNSDDVRVSLGLAAAQYSEGGAAAEEYGRRVETTAARLDILRNRLQTLAINAGTPALGVLAAAADLAGDAIIALGDTLGPLAAQVVNLFSNMGAAAGTFFGVIDGPAIGALSSGLTGLVAVLGGVAEGLNSLGQAGALIAGIGAGLLVFNARTGGAVTAVKVLALELRALGVSGALAKVGITSVGTALVAGSLVAGVGIILGVGKALNDARSAAAEAATVFETRLSNAIDSENFREASRAIDETRSRIEALRALDEVPDGLSGGWDGFGASVRSVAQILTPFTENTMVNARLEADALEAVQQKLGDRTLALADIYDTTEGNILQAAVATGVLTDVVEGEGQAYQIAQREIQGYLLAQDETATTLGRVADASEDMTLAIVNGTASAGEFFKVVGLGVPQINALATIFPEMSDALELVFSDDKIERAQGFATVVDLVDGELAELARQTGTTTDGILAQVSAVTALAESHNQLQAAVSGAIGALEQMQAQERATAAATTEFEHALAEVGGSTESIELAAGAMAKLVANLVASGTPVQQAIDQQGDFRQSLIDAAVAQGANEESARRAVDAYLLTAEGLAVVAERAQSYKSDVLELTEAQKALAGRYEIELFTDAEQSRAEFANAMGLVGEWQDADLLRVLNVDADAARAEFEAATATALGYSTGDYDVVLDADGSPAREETAFTKAELEAMSAAEYLSTLTSDGSPARQESDFTEAELRAMSAAEYLATLTSDGAPARRESATTRADMERTARGPYNATITGDSSQAVEAARQARAAIDSVRGKTVTIRVNRVTQFEDGGIHSARYDEFAGGGVRINGASPIAEKPGRPGVYKAVFPGRLFAEPATGDEAYIPLGKAKRPQALAVFKETGRRLGVFEDGGIMARNPIRPGAAALQSAGVIVQISAPMQFDFGAGGAPANLDEIREVVSATVETSMKKASRRLASERILA